MARLARGLEVPRLAAQAPCRGREDQARTIAAPGGERRCEGGTRSEAGGPAPVERKACPAGGAHGGAGSARPRSGSAFEGARRCHRRRVSPTLRGRLDERQSSPEAVGSPMFIPESLKWLGRHEAGRRWLNRLPLVLDELVERWGLEWRGEPSSGGSLAYVAPVSRGGARFVLKVQWPHEESVHEAEALKTWNGDGAVRLIDHDGTRHALLLEECVPGTNLADAGDADPLGILAGLLPRLWKPAGQPFLPLSDVARQWALDLPQAWERAGRPCERLLVDAALEHLEALPPTQGEESSRPSGPSWAQRAGCRSPAMAGDRSEAVARRTRVLARADRPQLRVRPLRESDALPAGPSLFGARVEPRSSDWLDGGADDGVELRQQLSGTSP